VSTIGADDLAMVISSHPLMKLVVNRENILAHEKVIEEVMKKYCLAGEVLHDCLKYDEIRSLLFKDTGIQKPSKGHGPQVELGVKVCGKIWTVFSGRSQRKTRRSVKIKKRLKGDGDKRT